MRTTSTATVSETQKLLFLQAREGPGRVCSPLKVEEEDHAVKMLVREENQRNVARNLHFSQYGAGKLVGGRSFPLPFPYRKIRAPKEAIEGNTSSSITG